MKGIEGVKGAPSKPNPSPNAFPKLCEWFSGRFLLKGRGTRTVPSLRRILVKSPESENKAQRKVEYKNYHAITMSRNYKEKLYKNIIRRNYYRKLSGEIITENYQLVYQSRGKCEIYRDTGISKKRSTGSLVH